MTWVDAVDLNVSKKFDTTPQQQHQRQNYTLLEQKGIISSIIDEIIKFEKT